MTFENEPQNTPTEPVPTEAESTASATPKRRKPLRRVAVIAALCAVLGGGAGFGLAQLTEGPRQPKVIIKPSLSPSPEASASPYETFSPEPETPTPEPMPTDVTPTPELTPSTEPIPAPTEASPTP
jgi:hypothetical protein